MYKNIFKITLIFLISDITNAAFIQSSPGQLTAMRTTSEYHGSVPAGMTETLFKLSSGHPGCEWLGVNNNDRAFVSMLISAQAQSTAVSIWYDNEKFSPIWGNICQAMTIEIK